MGRAANPNQAVRLHQRNEQLRTSFGASAAAGAKVTVHHGQAILNGKSAKFADIDAVSKAQAAIGAASAAFIEGAAGFAGFGTLIVHLVLRGIKGSGALDKSLYILYSGKLHAQDLTDLTGNRLTAGDTQIGFGVGVLRQLFGVIIAASKAAGAAVGAGQNSANIFCGLIDGNSHQLSGDDQNHAQNQTDYRYGYNSQHYIASPFT